MEEKLRGIVDSYAVISPSGWDWLDLFYTYERSQRWGALVPRSTWMPRRFSPFLSPSLLIEAFRLPIPLCDNFNIHKELIRCASFPYTYFLPLNYKYFLPLRGHSKVKWSLSRVAEKGLAGWSKIRSTLLYADSSSSHEAERAAVFRGFLGRGLRDRLQEDGGIGGRVLDVKAFERIMEDHESGKSNHLPVLGCLAIMEAYRHMVEEASRLASEVRNGC